MLAIRIFGAACALAATALGADPVDPLSAKVDDSAAQRFAAIWRASDGKPSADTLQRNYLAGGGRALSVFTPDRIVDAQNLAANVAHAPQVYADAVNRCLPWVAATNPELRATYLGLRGLLPRRSLPQIAVVIGANNSGGTAGPGIQVIGLEVICRLSPTQEAFAGYMRRFFAHETVHTMQRILSKQAARNPMLAQALVEGGADYVTALVAGRIPESTRDTWARERERWIWQQFVADMATVKAGSDAHGDLSPAAQTAFSRWFANAGAPPSGWPSELGYWVGMRICEAYVAKSGDPHKAIEQILDFAGGPDKILAASGYAG